MEQQIRILVKPEQVADAILGLGQIEDVQVQVQTEDIAEPDASQTHPMYQLSPQEIATIIVSVAGLTTSLVSLAKAIFELKTEKYKQDKKESSYTPPFVIVNQRVIVVAEFNTPEQLAAHISKELEYSRH